MPSAVLPFERSVAAAPSATGNRLLDALAPPDRAVLLAEARYGKLAWGEALFAPGEPVREVVFPLSGLVSLMAPLGDGEVETASRGRTGAVGHLEACGAGVATLRAVVQIRGEALCVPAPRVRERFEASSGFRDLMLRRIEFQLAEARRKSVCRAAHPVWRRLIRTLLACRDETGRTRLPFTQEALASLMGVQRTTVTGAAGRLQDLGLIRYTRGVVTLLDVQGLEAHACECRAALLRLRETAERSA